MVVSPIFQSLIRLRSHTVSSDNRIL